MSYELLQGDCLEVMRGLPAGSVQCVVTSPPYYGLRDYGTAQWEGGDAACDHRQPGTKTGNATTLRNDGRAHTGPYENENALTVGYPYRNLCGKCGARRIDQQIGLESTPDAYVAKLVDVFREVRRLLHPSGVVWLNLGDSYASSNATIGRNDEDRNTRNVWSGGNADISHWKANGAPNQGSRSRMGDGLKPKDLIGIPWMVAFALRADGWYLRSEIIWAKKAPMPESVTDRPTKAHEQVFLLAKSPTYYYDHVAIMEAHADPNRTHFGHGAKLDDSRHDTDRMDFGRKDEGRNKRSVWTLGPESYAGAHFATMPTKLVEPCILAGSKVGDTVLDPFNGSGTTGAVALKHHRRYVGIDLNADYIEMAHDRIRRMQPLLLVAD